jgi:ADP-heptose:LPS heptosyltransferase
LVRLDGIGDAAVCTPLVAALRAAGHEVGVALTTRNAGLFASHAIVAEHVLERIPWPEHGSTEESRARANAEIAEQRYDAALIASEEPEAYQLAAPIRVRVGFITGLATRPLKTLWVRSRVTRTVRRDEHDDAKSEHEVETIYRLGAGFVRTPLPPIDLPSLRDALLEDGWVVRHNESAVLQAGPKWRVAGVGDAVLYRLVERLLPDGLRVLAGPGEADQVRAVLGLEPETCADLRSWIDVLAHASTVITVDTGAAHVAGMLGPHVIDVFPDADFEAQVRRWRPWASPYRALRASDVNAGGGDELAEVVLDGF